MLLELVRSPHAVDTILLLMLLAWLGGSAAMMLRTERATRGAQAETRRRGTGRHSSTTIPPEPTPAAGSLRP